MACDENWTVEVRMKLTLIYEHVLASGEAYKKNILSSN